MSFLAQSSSSGPNSAVVFVGWLALLAAIFFLMSRRQRTRFRKRQAFLSELAVGQSVRSIGGIVGTISELDDQFAVLRMEDGNKIRFLRSAIADRQDG